MLEQGSLHRVGQDSAVAQHCEDWEEGWRKDAIRHQEEALQVQATVSIITMLSVSTCTLCPSTVAKLWVCTSGRARCLTWNTT